MYGIGEYFNWEKYARGKPNNWRKIVNMCFHLIWFFTVSLIYPRYEFSSKYWVSNRSYGILGRPFRLSDLKGIFKELL